MGLRPRLIWDGPLALESHFHACAEPELCVTVSSECRALISRPVGTWIVRIPKAWNKASPPYHSPYFPYAIAKIPISKFATACITTQAPRFLLQMQSREVSEP
jgi:hypothetical protein